MKRLLFPTDFSKAAENAFDYALKLADSLQAEIHFLHAYHYTLADTTYMPGELLHALEVEQEEEALRLIAHHERMVQERLGKKVPVTHKLTYGFAQDRILEYASEIQADLIVMGTTGAGNALGKLVGGVTSSVMDKAPCPILAIPEGAKYRPIENLVYASGFTKGDQEIFAQLVAFSQLMKTELSCVHIRTESESVMSPEVKEQEAFYRKQVEESGLEYYLLDYPDVAEGLDNFLGINQTDILLMMTHKRSLLEKVFSPSLSRKMVLHTEVPMLIFRQETLSHLVQNGSAAI